jgi:hypothetical protein
VYVKGSVILPAIPSSGAECGANIKRVRDKFMAEYNEFDDGNEPESENELIKHLRKQIRERDSRLKAIEQERDALKVSESTRTLNDLLDGAEVPTKFRAMATRMGVEATPEAVQEFIKDFGELWGFESEEKLSDEEAAQRDQQSRAQRAQEQSRQPQGRHEITEADLMNMNANELEKYLKTITD